MASTIESLRAALDPSVIVDTIDHRDLSDPSEQWIPSTRLLVMPGGADLPYCERLNGRGNAVIDKFVRNGGSYLGLCAGAYYACRFVEFEVGSSMEVKGSRELGFYPGIGRGCMYPGFHYANEDGAVAAPIRFRKFTKESDGKRRTEAGAWGMCCDYLNGGPGFVHPNVFPEDSLPEESSTGEYEMKTRSSFDGSNEYAGSESWSGAKDDWLRREHMMTAESMPQGRDALANIEILAEYIDHDGAASALLCYIGSGRAVLCASHPELGTDWLALPPGGGRSDAVQASAQESNRVKDLYDSGAYLLDRSEQNDFSDVHEFIEQEKRIKRLRETLEAHQGQRWKFWLSLLMAAGLEDVILSNDMDATREQILS